MKSQRSLFRFRVNTFHCAVVSLCGSSILSFGQTVLVAQEQSVPAPAAQSQVLTNTTPTPDADLSSPKIPNDQLDSLVAPIALFPDPLLAQKFLQLVTAGNPDDILIEDVPLGDHAR